MLQPIINIEYLICITNVNYKEKWDTIVEIHIEKTILDDGFVIVLA